MVSENPDSINEFVIAGEFGFNRIEGPWTVEKDGTMWTVIIPYDEMDRVPDHRDEGEAVVLIADGQTVGGGIVDTVYDPEDEGETHVLIDQYAMGDVQ